MIDRRHLIAIGAAALALPAQAAGQPPLTVIKGAGCACCDGWVAHMRRAGFTARVIAVDDIAAEHRRRGVAERHASCHLGLVGGYVTVGHVPPADVKRLLGEKPKAIGIAVPGMPQGSPGMERADGRVDPYQTLLLLPGGQTRVYARHG